MYFLSISDSGKGRIIHNRGGRLAARSLQALGENTVSEAKEEGLVRLLNGLVITYSTVTSTYDDKGGVTFRALIDAADGPEPLLNRHVGALILCIDFTGTTDVTYTRGTGKTISLSAPKEGVLFCPISTHMSYESLQCVAKGIKFPKEVLMLALAIENGKSLGDDWLVKNPPHGNWKGESPSLQCILTLSIRRYS